MGEIFLPEARLALEQVARAIQVAQQAAQGEIGRLRVGYVGSMLYSFLPEVLHAFRQRFPTVDVTLRELGSSEQMIALERNQIDLGILNGPIQDSRFHIECAMRPPLCVALPRSHPLAEQEQVGLIALQHEPFILVSREHEPAVHARYLSLCQQAGFVPRVVQEASQIQTILGLVSLGIGVFLVPDFVKTIQPHRGVAYVTLAEPTPRGEFDVVWRQEDTSPPLRQFWKVIQETVELAAARGSASAKASGD